MNFKLLASPGVYLSTGQELHGLQQGKRLVPNPPYKWDPGGTNQLQNAGQSLWPLCHHCPSVFQPTLVPPTHYTSQKTQRREMTVYLLTRGGFEPVTREVNGACSSTTNPPNNQPSPEQLQQYILHSWSR